MKLHERVNIMERETVRVYRKKLNKLEEKVEKS